MNVNLRRLFPALLCLGALLPLPPLAAQSIPSPYRYLENNQEAGIFVGSMDPGTGRFELGPDGGVAFGARYGFNISGPFGLEGVVSYLPTERAMVDPSREEGDLKIGTLDTDMVMLDARIRFTLTGDRSWKGIAPHILAGGGLAFEVAGDDSDRDALLAGDRFGFGTSFVGILGGGMRWFPGRRFVVRTDGVLFMWRLKTPSGFTDPDRDFEGVGETEWVSGPSFSISLGYRF